ncbi:hypothetical protein P280DRAFT_520212 [Massarina eburnea CBS 473.64]|uniref:Aminoglycoside phosphotransferase domain-containing protein n=1 Tax=Massarina eburnea CBS 473.64 TaxID=1395130 RepID=A0A6A6RST1_9PLEO|nr:hypothetical protein P280DRAFT_520212 [Massarina eburnea CBS 473.64]
MASSMVGSHSLTGFNSPDNLVGLSTHPRFSAIKRSPILREVFLHHQPRRVNILPISTTTASLANTIKIHSVFASSKVAKTKDLCLRSCVSILKPIRSAIKHLTANIVCSVANGILTVVVQIPEFFHHMSDKSAEGNSEDVELNLSDGTTSPPIKAQSVTYEPRNDSLFTKTSSIQTRYQSCPTTMARTTVAALTGGTRNQQVVVDINDDQISPLRSYDSGDFPPEIPSITLANKWNNLSHGSGESIVFYDAEGYDSEETNIDSDDYYNDKSEDDDFTSNGLVTQKHHTMVTNDYYHRSKISYWPWPGQAEPIQRQSRDARLSVGPKPFADERIIRVLCSNVEPLQRGNPDPKIFNVEPVTDGGSFHIIVFVNVLKGEAKGEYVIKVPRSGLPQLWTTEDGFNLTSEVMSMSLISKTGLKVPDVLGYGETCDNALGAPYILMRRAEGVPACSLWFDHLPNGDVNLETARNPTQSLRHRRKKILKACAKEMSKLGMLSFTRTGLLNADIRGEDEFVIGNVWSWTSQNDGSEQLETEGSYETAADFFAAGLEELYPMSEDCEHNEASFEMTGQRIFQRLILSCPAFEKSCAVGEEEETFVFRHDDFNLQNVLFDDELNLSCILDWDKVRIVPRSIGFASLPIPLVVDYFEDFEPHTLGMYYLAPGEREEYRELYAKTMIKMTGPQGDGRFTLNSGWYQYLYALQRGYLFHADPDHFHYGIMREGQFGQWPDAVYKALATRDGKISFDQAYDRIMEVMAPKLP